jgi:hypothetical protein
MISKQNLLNALLDERRRAEQRERELLDTIMRLSNRGTMFAPTFEEPAPEPEGEYYSALDVMDGS